MTDKELMKQALEDDAIEAAGEKIKQALSSYRMHGMQDKDGDGYPLVDCLSVSGATILSGQHEIELLVDHILYYLIPPSGRLADVKQEKNT